MTLQRLMQVAIAVMAAFGTTLLAIGERQPLLALLAIIIAGCAVYFNDIQGWVRLRTKGENLACLVAVAVALVDLTRFGRDSQLLAAANLLAYLQFILLFQEKTIRRYWMLALLSLMQVAVATALGLELSFGLMLFAYLLLALATLSIFFAYREIRRYSPALTDAEGRLPALSISGRPTSQRHDDRDRTSLLAGAGQRLGSIASSTVGENEPLTWRYARLVLAMAAGTFATAFALFFVIPRVEQTSWRRPRIGAAAVVGIPETVSLQDVGTIYESPEAVMRVSFHDQSGRSYDLREPPLFRGFHLTVYDQNRWRETTEPYPEPMHLEEVLSSSNYIQQKIEARPAENDVLFHVGWPVKRQSLSMLLIDYRRERLLRPPGHLTQNEVHLLATNAFVDGRQSRFIPAERPPRNSNTDPYRHVPVSLTRLPSIAAEVVSAIDADDKLARIDAINNYLIDPERFAYSLQSSRQDTKIDAVEDFLTNNPRGHCEFFASAMALMLRSVGIPARIVIGYKGDEFNTLGEFYQVRQLHAHAWVEAYLSHDELPTAVRARSDQWKRGGWYAVDPSPISRIDEIQATTAMQFLTLRQLADYARFLWSGYVMGMDAQRQQRTIYSLPVTAARKLADRKFWIRTGNRFARIFRQEGEGSVANGWVNLRTVSALLASIGLSLGVWRTVRHARNRWLAQNGGAVQTAAPPPRKETALLRKLESILARQDFHRPDSQTPLEYATTAGGLLAQSPATRHVAGLPRSVVDTFYRWRFAGHALDKHELNTLEQSLAQLETAIIATEIGEGAKQE